MTRLTTNDIYDISSRLGHYDKNLIASTGHSMLGIAAHAWGVDETRLIDPVNSFSIHVVPVTAGQGVISNFSETVAAILSYLGIKARVTEESDTSGLAFAYENKADGVMMADDNRFVGLNLKTQAVADNTKDTGRVFAAALDFMAGGINNRDVLIVGCGPVGKAAAEMFLDLGGLVVLYDIQVETAVSLQKVLSRRLNDPRVRVEEDLSSALSRIPYVLEASPSSNSIPDELISHHMRVAAPGVPLGVSKQGCKMLGPHLVHDKLELGVAAMAVNLVLSQLNQSGKTNIPQKETTGE